MSEEDKPRSWWYTMPGILTAVAALVTAIGGLLGILLAYGVIGGSEQPEAGEQRPYPTRTTRPPGNQPSVTPPATTTATDPADASVKPWSDVQAIYHTTDGTVRVRADSLAYCLTNGHALPLTNGQALPFEKVRTMKVLRTDEQFAPNGKADLEITLTDGTSMNGSVGSGCSFIGYNDLGRFEVYPQKVKLLEIQH